MRLILDSVIIDHHEVRIEEPPVISALGKLRSQAADQGGRGDAEGSEAAAADVRDGDHRAPNSSQCYARSEPASRLQVSTGKVE
jgi:hypothetical protein